MESPLCLPRSVVTCCIFLLCSGKPTLQLSFLNKTHTDMDITRALEAEASQGTSVEAADKEEPLRIMKVPWLIEQEPETVDSGEALENLEVLNGGDHFLLVTVQDIQKNFTEREHNFIDTDAYRFTEVWKKLADIIKTEPRIVPVYITSVNSSNRSLAYPNTNGSIGIGHPANITNDFDTLSQNIINSFIFIVCLGGLVGNGVVIWFLGFHIKRNPFTTYILNLSIADFAVLICLLSTATFTIGIGHYRTMDSFSHLFLICFELFFFTYSASQFLLAVISIDRCVAVLFPLWHRCHRPRALSALVCALIWILSFLLSAVHFTLLQTGSLGGSSLIYQLIVNVFLCTPLMLISTLTLCGRFCCRTKQRQQGKLMTVILLALFAFLILSLPLNVTYVVHSFSAPQPKLLVLGLACSSLNSSVNPLIYFFIGGRQKKCLLRVCLKVALQTVFKDEEDSLEEKHTKMESLL
ncbi:proto-oncogene Mas [Pogona vitticeps]